MTHISLARKSDRDSGGGDDDNGDRGAAIVRLRRWVRIDKDG